MEMLCWGLVSNGPLCHHGPQLLYVSACSIFLLINDTFFEIFVRVTHCEVSCENAYLLGESHTYFQHLFSVVGDVVNIKGVLRHGNPYFRLSGHKDGLLEAYAGREGGGCSSFDIVKDSRRVK